MKPLLACAAVWLGLVALGGAHHEPQAAEGLAALSLVLALASCMGMALDVLEELVT